MATTATIPGMKKGTYDALAAAGDTGLLKHPGNPQDAPQVGDYLRRDSLPKALRPFEEMIRRAVARELPVRPQEWQKRGYARSDKQVFDEDPNARVILAANNFLLLFEEHRAGRSLPDDRRKADDNLAILRRWQQELAPILNLMRQLDAALTTFRKSAPLRITE